MKTNWSANIIFCPSAIYYPTSENEIRSLIINAINSQQKIRAIGSGHSFTALCQTNDILISLDKYQGIVSVDASKQQVTVKAGTKLKLLGDLLFQQGLAMENLGDIDAQSIGGTISTGTHGTGIAFGTISTQVVRLKLVNGKGEIVVCSATENPALFKAAQVSLGSMGIITEITLQCVPTYKLLIKNEKENVGQVLASLPERLSQNRNFEYYWFPHTDTAWTKTTNIALEGKPAKDSLFNYLSELIVENYTFKILCEIGRLLPSQTKHIASLVAGSVPTISKINYSHKVYASIRLVRFTEMEYNVPAEAYEDVMREIMKKCKAENFPVHFPIENRWVKGDDILLSPAYGRDSAYIACHVYHKQDNSHYFQTLEAIFRAYGGRPHWGKMHTQTTHTLADMYPQFAAFNALRKQQDPDDIFINPYLEKLFN
ncbi:MAG: FAD-binding protein [Chitinophagales bacterium]|nr:FAD-binding protein [Chitinophagales bacterium]